MNEGALGVKFLCESDGKGRSGLEKDCKFTCEPRLQGTLERVCGECVDSP